MGERRTGPIPRWEQDPEKELERKPHEMARVFIAQSKSTEQVRAEMYAGKKPYEISFLNLVFAQKSGDSMNPDELLPVGGSRVIEERPLDAARRHMMEETHLRPVDLVKVGSMSFGLKKYRDEIDAKVHSDYYLAKVLPHDELYSLNPEDDKIVRYHHVDLATYEDQVLRDGYLIVDDNGDEKKLPLVDSLRVNDGSGLVDNLLEDNTARASLVQEKLLKSLKDDNDRKSRWVVEHWLDILDVSGSEKDDVLNLLEKEGKDWKMAFDTIWSWAIKTVFKGDVKAAQESFLAAYDLSIFEEEVGEELKNQTKDEALFRAMLALLESKYDYDSYLKILKDNPRLKDFAVKVESFLGNISDKPEDSHESSHREQAIRSKSLDVWDEDYVEDAFIDSFFGDKRTYDRGEFKKKFAVMNATINELLDENIVRGKLVGVVGEKFNDRLLTQISEVRDANLIDLIKLAWPGVAKDEKHRFRTKPEIEEPQNPNILKRAVFEARRKLAYLFILFDADSHYGSVVENGKGEIEKVWGEILEGPTVYRYLTEEKGENGDLLDIKVSKSKSPDQSSQETVLRPCKLEDGNYTLFAQSARTKSRQSFYRKVLVRGKGGVEDIKDIYGRSLVVAPSASVSIEDLLKKDSQVLQTYNEDGSSRDLEEFTDYRVVLEIIQRLQNNPNVKILKYIPTNDPGSSFSSSGVGGGAEICLAKFYIEHTNEKGEKNYEEVQIFSPTDEEHSGFYWEKTKKKDDSSYDFERVLRPDKNRLHSFVEVNYPARIYGAPIKNANVGVVVRKNGKKNGK